MKRCFCSGFEINAMGDFLGNKFSNGAFLCRKVFTKQFLGNLERVAFPTEGTFEKVILVSPPPVPTEADELYMGY